MEGGMEWWEVEEGVVVRSKEEIEKERERLGEES